MRFDRILSGYLFLEWIILSRNGNGGLSVKSHLCLMYILSIMVTIIIPQYTCEAEKLLIANGQYYLIDGENQKDGENIAFQYALMNAVQQTETIVSAYSEINNMQLSKDVIYAVSAGIVHIKNKEVVWKNPKEVLVDISVSVDEEKLQSQINDMVSNYKVVLQYKQLKDDFDALIEENNSLRTQMNTLHNKIQINNISQRIKDNNQRFLAQVLFEQALNLYVDKEYEAAISAIDSSLEIDRLYINAYGLRSSIYDDMGQKDKALADLNYAIGISDDYYQLYANRSLIYKENGDFNAAITDINKAISLSPNTPYLYYLRGNLNGFKSYEQGIADYNKAISLDSGLYEAYAARGMCYTFLEQFEKAYDDAMKAISINPFSGYPYVSAAVALTNMGNYRAALDNINKAIKYEEDAGQLQKCMQMKKILENALN